VRRQGWLTVTAGKTGVSSTQALKGLCQEINTVLKVKIYSVLSQWGLIFGYLVAAKIK
jgi:hypothetical protein